MNLRWVALSMLLLLAGCGDLPEPFLGNPGGAAMTLRQPPDPRLAIPTPPDALLSDDAARALAADLADRLQQGEVPAYAQKPAGTDWHLVISAQLNGGSVVPRYTVFNPQGKPQGTMAGAPVPTASWANGDPATLHQVALQAAPGIASMLTGIETGIMKADPNSLYNRAAEVLVPDVTGAPGDGNVALARLLRTKLTALGPKVEMEPKTPPDITVQGQVRMVTIPGNQQRVEIQWIVKDARGREAGRVIQLNEIPAGSLDHYWGDVAGVITDQASGGVNEIIKRVSRREPDTAASPPAPATPQTAPTPTITPPATS